MNGRTMIVALLLGIVAFLGGRAASQEGKTGDQPAMPGPEQMQAMMKKWLDTVQPGEHHKPLAQFAGDWETVTKMWMAGPTMPPTESKGASTVKWIMDGRYLMEDHNGDMLMPGMDGQMQKLPYKGLGLSGYDNYKNLYTGVWINNMGTEMLTMTGTSDPSGKVFTYYGQMDEAMLDVHGRMVKYVNRVINDDKHVFEVYDLHAGDNYKVVEVTYTRKK